MDYLVFQCLFYFDQSAAYNSFPINTMDLDPFLWAVEKGFLFGTALYNNHGSKKHTDNENMPKQQKNIYFF